MCADENESSRLRFIKPILSNQRIYIILGIFEEMIKLIMGVVIVLLLLGGGYKIFDIWSNSSFNVGETKDIEFQEINKGEYSPIIERKELLIDDSDKWSMLWASMFPSTPNIPNVDFNVSDIVAIFQGEKRSGGYSLEIKNVLSENNKIKIFIDEYEPSEECVTIQVLTQPYHIIEMPKTDKSVEFVYNKQVRAC